MVTLIDLKARILTQFQTAFGFEPTITVQAPARVNLIGEHTDYNDGFVLPCAINYQTLVCASPRQDGQVRVVAADYAGELDIFSCYEEITRHPSQQWANYVRGVIKYLRDKAAFGGADLAIGGNIPQGAGLSSSASLEVAIGQAFKALYDLPLSQIDLARIGQQAENKFVGCHCGIMDQLISAEAALGNALLIDCRSLQAKPVPIPAGVTVLITNSNVRRGLVESEYNMRRKQCEAAAQHLGVHALRDATLEQLEASASSLEPVTWRRARHIITENTRTLAAAEALASSDLSTMARLMEQSHHSMRDDFEITHPAIDHLVCLIKDAIGDAGGVRMTGGGFGGCVVALLPDALIEQAQQAVIAGYSKKTGLEATFYICQPQAGAGLVAGS